LVHQHDPGSCRVVPPVDADRLRRLADVDAVELQLVDEQGGSLRIPLLLRDDIGERRLFRNL